MSSNNLSKELKRTSTKNIDEIQTDYGTYYAEIMEEYDYVNYTIVPKISLGKESIFNYFSDIWIDDKIKVSIKFEISKMTTELVGILKPDYMITSCTKSNQVELKIERTGYLIRIYSDEPFDCVNINYEAKLNQVNNCDIILTANSGWFLGLFEPFEANDIYFNVKSNYNVIINAEKNTGKYKYKIKSYRNLMALIKKEKCMQITISKDGVDCSKNIKNVFDRMQIEKELNRFMKFYTDIFNRTNKVTVIDSSMIKSSAVSYENLIVFHPTLLNHPSTFFYKYLLHEIIHQEIGIKIKFQGYGGEWIKESFTEYLQLLYLKERFNDNLYFKSLDYYGNLYFDNISAKNEVSIAECYFGMPNDKYLASICGKGTRLFVTLFSLVNDNRHILKSIIRKLQKLERRIDIFCFKEIIKKYFPEKEIDQFYYEWIERSGIPHYILHWEYKHGYIHLRLKQKTKIFMWPVKIRIYLSSGTFLEKVLKPDGIVYHDKIKSDYLPDRVIIDPNRILLCRKEVHKC